MSKHILVLDEGTTSTRAVLFDSNSVVVDEESMPIAVHTPKFGYVEHDANEIIDNSIAVLKAVISRANELGREIDSLAITNQRTATTIMDRDSGSPITRTIGWQDVRATDRTEEMREHFGDRFVESSGMNLSAANCALHMYEMFKDPELKALSGTGKILIGTPDTLMIKALTGNNFTSAANASSSGALNQHTGEWWAEFIEINGGSVGDFAEILPEDGDYGTTLMEVLGIEIPLAAVVPDQQSALFGHGGLAEGSVKCTHGTGTFIDFNVGDRVLTKLNGLDSRYGWRIDGSLVNVIEGSTFVSGSAIEWLIDDLKVLENPQELDRACNDATSPEVIVVPALAGFAAPYWDAESRGTVFGLSRHTSHNDIIRGTVEGVAHTVVDLLELITEMTGSRISSLAVDGGLALSDYLQQFTADMLGAPVERTEAAEHVTARGSAWIAGIKRGIWTSPEEAIGTLSFEKRFEPQISDEERNKHREAWKDAVSRSLNWKPKRFN